MQYQNGLTEAHVSDDPVPVDEGDIARMSWLLFRTSSYRRCSALKGCGSRVASYLYFTRSSLGRVTESLHGAHV